MVSFTQKRGTNHGRKNHRNHERNGRSSEHRPAQKASRSAGKGVQHRGAGTEAHEPGIPATFLGSQVHRRLFPSDTSILRSDGAAPFCRGESAGSKNDDGTDAGIPVGLSAAPELQQSDHRQHSAEHFQFFLMAGRGRPHSEKPHAPHPQNQNQENREGGHLRRGHRKAPRQLHQPSRPGHD